MYIDENRVNFKIEQTAPVLPNGCSLIAENEGLRIGYAHITVSQNVATLADIKVNVMTTKPFMWFPFYKKTDNYRGKGVGSALLKRVVEICKEARISEILGHIYGDEELLIAWYRKFGFEIKGKNIKLDLSNNLTGLLNLK